MKHDELYQVLCGGPRNTITTFWYKASEALAVDAEGPRLFSAGKRKNLMRGVRQLAAVFLLEAMVLGSAVGSWGQWLPAFYGTSRPDVWEIFGGHAKRRW